MPLPEKRFKVSQRFHSLVTPSYRSACDYVRPISLKVMTLRVLPALGCHDDRAKRQRQHSECFFMIPPLLPILLIAADAGEVGNIDANY